MAQRVEILSSTTPPYHLYVKVYQFLVSKKMRSLPMQVMETCHLHPKYTKTQ